MPNRLVMVWFQNFLDKMDSFLVRDFLVQTDNVMMSSCNYYEYQPRKWSLFNKHRMSTLRKHRIVYIENRFSLIFQKITRNFGYFSLYSLTTNSELSIDVYTSLLRQVFPLKNFSKKSTWLDLVFGP